LSIFRESCQRGEDCHNSKLTEKEVLKIRKLKRLGFAVKTIANRFSISLGHIRKIVNRESWRHI